jgi:hypothetical protein
MLKFKALKSEIIFTIAALLIFTGFGFFVVRNVSEATVSAGALSTDVASGDNVVGRVDANYRVEFDTDISATATTISIVFPANYAGNIQNGLIADFNNMNEAINCGAFGLVCGDPGRIIVDGNSVLVTEVNGNQATRTITLTIPATDLSGGVVFGILLGITNPTTAGTTGTFTITTNAAGESGQSGIAGVSLIADSADHLSFSPAPAGSVSGYALTTQPKVSVRDAYENLITNFEGDITLSLASGGGTLGGTLVKPLVNGIATFTDLEYRALEDQESFTLAADNAGFPQIVSGAVVSNVVADRFAVTAGRNSNQNIAVSEPLAYEDFTISAVDAYGLVDTGYDASTKTFEITGDGTLMSTHISPGGFAPGIPASEDIALGFADGVYDPRFSGISFTKAETIELFTVTSFSGGIEEFSGSIPNLVVTPAGTSDFRIIPDSYSAQIGVPLDVRITSLDSRGNITDADAFASPYTGTITITSNAVGATINPASYQFTIANNGVKYFENLITFSQAASNIQITATDFLIDGNSDFITVGAAPSSGGGGIIIPGPAPFPPANSSPSSSTSSPAFPPLTNSGEVKDLEPITCSGNILSRIACEAELLAVKKILMPLGIVINSEDWRALIISFGDLFKRTPSTVLDWQDIIKLSLGRWPQQSNAQAELQAEQDFKQIYLREANRNNPNDDAAIIIMAYGLRPAPRNLNSELFALGIYLDIFKQIPISAGDWNKLRAIAYSGAVR